MGRSKKIIGNTQVCSKCEIDKPIDQYDMKTSTTNRPDCKDCRKVRNKDYYEKSRNKVITCECGQDIKYSNRYEHKKTKKHKSAVELI